MAEFTNGQFNAFVSLVCNNHVGLLQVELETGHFDKFIEFLNNDGLEIEINNPQYETGSFGGYLNLLQINFVHP